MSTPPLPAPEAGQTVRDYLTSVVRTGVPVLVALVLARLGIDLAFEVAPGVTLTYVVAGVVITAYYALVRLAEQRWRRVGWLLGRPVRPLYADPAGRVEVPTGVEVVTPEGHRLA